MLQRTLPIVAATLLQIVPPASAQTSNAAVAVQQTTFKLASSGAGNANYFVNVNVYYAPPDATVRFRCELSDGDKSVSLYGVLRQSGGSLRFVSPFATSSSSSPVKTVQCFVDKT
jgi:hypothetical protein